MPKLNITNLLTSDQVFSDPSGLTGFSVKVAASATSSGNVLSDDTLVHMQAALDAAVAASRITYTITADAADIADVEKDNVRLGLVSPIVATALDEVIVCKLTAPGAVAVTIPAALPIGSVVEVVDGTGDASSNNITITPTGGTINGAGTLVLNTDYGAARLVKTAANTWLRTSPSGGAAGAPTGAAGGALSGTYPNPALATVLQGVEQALSGAGAVDVTHRTTQFTSTGAAQALTLADGATVGQRKSICHKVDGGSGVLTPATASGFVTATFTNVRDCLELEWQAGGWRVVSYTGCTFT